LYRSQGNSWRNVADQGYLLANKSAADGLLSTDDEDSTSTEVEQSHLGGGIG